MNRNIITTILVIIILVVGAVIIFGGNGEDVVPNNMTNNGDTNEELPEGWRAYNNQTYSLSFAYPAGEDGYTLVEDQNPEGEALLALTLYNTQEYQEFQETGDDVARETPPAIGIRVFPRSEFETAREWVEGSDESNFMNEEVEISTTTVADTQGVSYRWSGLYEGESRVIVHNDYIYAFSSEFINQDDEIRDDFEDILEEVDQFGTSTQTGS